MIPLAVPNLAGNEARYLQACVESTFVSSVGEFVTRFEEMVAAAAGVRAAVATPSGTTGLHLALTALGVGRDDLVIMPSFTFIASANAVAHCGAMPWLLDIGADAWTLDPECLEAALQQESETRDGNRVHRATGRRIAAVMPVHALGEPADMDAIVGIARRYGLPVVADAAAALGASSRGRPVGALGADLSVFSFNGNKTVTAGGGGAVCGDDDELVAFARHLATTARTSADYDHDQIGFNYRMTNLEAAVGCAQLERLDALVGAKRAIRRRYEEALLDLAGLAAFPDPDHAEGGAWFSGVVVDPAVHGAIDGIRAALRERGIDARPFWKPIHHQKPYRTAPRGALDRTDGVWDRILTLPCSTGLTGAEQQQVIGAMREVLAA